MAFPIRLVTKASIIQWNYAELSCIKFCWKRRRNVGNPCRNHFRPFSQIWLPLCRFSRHSVFLRNFM